MGRVARGLGGGLEDLVVVGYAGGGGRSLDTLCGWLKNDEGAENGNRIFSTVQFLLRIISHLSKELARNC